MKLYQICHTNYYILPHASQLYAAFLQMVYVMILCEDGS